MTERETAASEMDAIVTGATTSSHPSATDDVEINRSGSGGTGGPSTDEDDGATQPADDAGGRDLP